MDFSQHLTPARTRSPRIYWRLDFASEILIYCILVLTPWAFGTTENWAIKSVNTANYILGGLLLAKWLVRGLTGFQPPRWDDPGELRGINPKWIIIPLAALTLFVLGFIALSAWNARAEFIENDQRFTYFESFNRSLPHSYARTATWDAFQLYLAVACFFWSLRDWLNTKTRRESRTNSDSDQDDRTAIGPEMDEFAGGYSNHGPAQFPARLKTLLWVICINGALLALQGTLQRLSGSNELLWSVRPRFNEYGWQQFGPFNYRGNGAQYMNLLWPVCLTFWWSLHQSQRKKFGAGAESLLPIFAGMMLAAPLIAGSRGGILIAVAQIFGIIGIVAYAFRKLGWRNFFMVAVFFFVVTGCATYLNWNRPHGIKERLSENTLQTFGGRKEIYDNAKKIIEDFPAWGTGPGSFPAVYQLYREDPSQTWFATAHDDYLQTLVTFGRVGFTAIMFMLVMVFAYWFLARGTPTSEVFVSLIWIGVTGTLLHARFDFPLQVYSILLLFMTLCAILTTLARP